MPCCPDWTVSDVVTHVGMVYEHKVRVMADNDWPSPWPPAALAEQEPVELLTDAKAHLFGEFAEHDLTDQTTTFSADDTTIAFWVRRMALEIAVHRFDAELAHDDLTPIPDDLALDGIDEVLRVMLAGPWWDGRVTTEHPIDAVVAVQAGDERWLCTADARSVSVAQDSVTPAAATVSGDPEAVYLWLWGRVGSGGIDAGRVDISGSPALAAELRARLVECTG